MSNDHEGDFEKDLKVIWQKEIDQTVCDNILFLLYGLCIAVLLAGRKLILTTRFAY